MTNVYFHVSDAYRDADVDADAGADAAVYDNITADTGAGVDTDADPGVPF